MAVNLPPPAALLPVAGVELAAAAAGIRYRDRDDLVLMSLAPESAVAAVFTRNAFCAAPVTVARRHLNAGSGIRALLINAGNANAGTGQQGLQAAEASCAAAALALDIDTEQVLPFSTGVIGQALPVEPFQRTLPEVAARLNVEGWDRAARAIMTTDTVPKAVSRRLDIGGRPVTLTGMAKGAGMIRPDMATLLAFIATDAPLAAERLPALLEAAVADSFNAMTVDGDTSTNDACVLVATGRAGGEEIRTGSDAEQSIATALNELCAELAEACIRDAEGATRLLTVRVEAAASVAEARRVAYAVAESPLVKTAAFAGDPNWGRILAAVGRSGVEDLDIGRVDLYLDEVCVLHGGEPDPDYSEARGSAVAGREEYTLRIRLGRGDAAARVWTCDFSYDYVRINAEYRS